MTDPVTDELAREFLRHVGTGRLDDVRRMLAATPALVNAVGPHPFWGGRPQALHWRSRASGAISSTFSSNTARTSTAQTRATTTGRR